MMRRHENVHARSRTSKDSALSFAFQIAGQKQHVAAMAHEQNHASSVFIALGTERWRVQDLDFHIPGVQMVA
jgi:hypothetical protein